MTRKKKSARKRPSRKMNLVSEMPMGNLAQRAVVEKQPLWYSFAKWILGIIGAILVPIFVFFVLFVFISFLITGEDLSLDGNVAVIPIKGTIVAEKTTGGLTGFQGTTATNIVKMIKKAEEDDNIKAMIFRINSPGGTAVASAEIATAVKKAKKPTVAVIREMGASGAFWVATAADTVYAHPLSVTGSIGVVSSYVEYAGLMNRYNLTYRRLVAGKYKDAGSPFKELTEEERAKFQQRIDQIHQYFIAEVSANRNVSIEEVRKVADGFILLGSEAKDLGFVDELGTEDDAVKYLEKKLNITVKKVIYKVKPSLLEALTQVTASPFYAIGTGIGDSLTTVETAYVPRVEY